LCRCATTVAITTAGRLAGSFSSKRPQTLLPAMVRLSLFVMVGQKKLTANFINDFAPRRVLRRIKQQDVKMNLKASIKKL
jgi:hypothetical protein